MYGVGGKLSKVVHAEFSSRYSKACTCQGRNESMCVSGFRFMLDWDGLCDVSLVIKCLYGCFDATCQC